MGEFEKELRELINRHNMEQAMDMPDWLMARLMCNMIEVMGSIVKKTLDWHGCDSVCHPRPNTLAAREEVGRG